MYADNLDFLVKNSKGKEMVELLMKELEKVNLQLKADVKILSLSDRKGKGEVIGAAEEYQPIKRKCEGANGRRR